MDNQRAADDDSGRGGAHGRRADRTDAAAFLTFIVPIKGTKGVTVSKPLELMLKSAGGVAQVFFEDVRVPASSLLGGEEGRGMAAALDCITTARLAQAARMVAMCELAFVQTVEFTRNRRAFGQTVFDFQNTKSQLASVKTELSVRTHLRRRAARPKRLGKRRTRGCLNGEAVGVGDGRTGAR